MNTFGADTEDDGTDWGQESVDERRAANIGLEMAAKWHDAKSEDYKELHALHIENGRELLARTALELASFHEDAAKSIRELMD